MSNPDDIKEAEQSGVRERLSEFFRCERFGTTLPRARCADLSRRADREGKRAVGHDAIQSAASNYSKCARCAVGQAHARGEVPACAPAVDQPKALVDLRAPRESWRKRKGDYAILITAPISGRARSRRR